VWVCAGVCVVVNVFVGIVRVGVCFVILIDVMNDDVFVDIDLVDVDVAVADDDDDDNDDDSVIKVFNNVCLESRAE
jgi:hypothetical protein